MLKVLSYEEIDKDQWRELVLESATGTWFQTPEAYEFFASMPELFKPFVVGLENEGTLRGVCVGYVTVEKSAIKQMMTRRAIIVGGPALADDCTDTEVAELMSAVRKALMNEPLHSMSRDKSLNEPRSLNDRPIYIECRNYNDYSRWKSAFAAAGFEYKAHLNFHVDTSSLEIVEANLGKSRKRDIRTSLRDGATIIEKPTLAQEREYYAILEHLYKTRVKTPLFPFSFFEKLWQHKDGRFILVALNGEIIGGTVCVEYLENLLKPIKKDYRVWLFRAANWSMMPTENLYRVLVKHGITHDTSVYKGGCQGGNVCYDYREAYDNLFAYPAAMTNINERDKKGQLIELPIYTEMRPFWDFVTPMRLFRMIRAKFHRHKKNESLKNEGVNELKSAADKNDRSKLTLKSFFRLSPLKMDFNQVNSRGLKRMMRNIDRRVSGEREAGGCGADWAFQDVCAI